MSSIKEAFKPTTSKNTSSKNPKFYNNEKNLLIAEASVNSDPAVRRFIAQNPHTPSKILIGMIEVEQDKQILRDIIMAPNMSRKAVAKFINSDDLRADWYDDDEEMAAHFKQ